MIQKLIRTWPTWAALPIRLALGLIFFAHGGQKVFGWWDGPGLSRFTAYPAPFGLKPGWLWMGAAALAELVGGALITLGLVTRAGSLLVLIVMLVAMFGVHWSGGFFLQRGEALDGIEYTVALAAMALALLVTGGGRLSLDEAMMDPRYRRR